jgi:hypothetical protein
MQITYPETWNTEIKQEFKITWIPIQKRRPESDDIYLVTLENNKVSVSMYTKEKGFDLPNVIAWAFKIPPYRKPKLKQTDGTYCSIHKP